MERVEDKRGGIDRSVKVSYDKEGNITGMVRQGRNGQPWEVRYDYDLKDRVIHADDCLGPVFRYEYDKNDRLLKKALSGSELDRFHAYSYDFRGNLMSEEDSAGTLQEKEAQLPGRRETGGERRSTPTTMPDMSPAPRTLIPQR